MTLPNFIIIGAAKSGTTSLYRHLSGHPQAFMSPIKETNYFAWDPGDDYGGMSAFEIAEKFKIRSPGDYATLFERAGDALAIGEASPRYLISEVAAANIARELPDARIVVSLRHPVERLLSDYLMQVRKGRRSLEVRPQFGASDRLVVESCYFDHLKRYFSRFARERVHVMLFDELEGDPVRAMASLCRFLGIEAQALPELSTAYNAGHVPRSRLLNRALEAPALRWLARRMLPRGRRKPAFVKRLAQRNLVERPDFPVEHKRDLLRLFEDDIARTGALIGRDLGAWHTRYADPDAQVETRRERPSGA